MFRRNKDDDDKPATATDENLRAPPLKPFSKKGTHAPSKPSTPAYRPEVARHVFEIPGSPAAPNETTQVKMRAAS